MPLFLNVNDDFGFAQFLRQALILAGQFLVLGSQWVLLRFRAALLRQSLMNGRIAFSPPSGQGRAIDPLAAQDYPDLARTRGSIHFGENLLLINRAETAPLCFRCDFRIRGNRNRSG